MLRLVAVLCAVSVCHSEPGAAEKLIAAGHWKRARALVEARIREAPDDALANFLLSQVHNAFGDHATPLPLAEKAVALDGRAAKYHRQIAEVLGVMAQHSNAIQQLLLARRFRREIDAALALDSRDVQAMRDLLEFYLLAPGIAGGDTRKAAAVAARLSEVDAAEGFLARARVAEFQRHAAEQESLLRKAVDAQPASYRARIVLAEFYLAPGHENPAAAEALAREALKLDRDRIDAYALLAGIDADRADWTNLESVLAGAAREVPDDGLPYYRAAERLILAGRDAERAERYLRRYMGQEPEGNAPTLADAAQQLKRLRSAMGLSSSR